ncbi:hypothetical protein Ahy_B08g092845 [Arachis hypogaea]|uniref:BED-type domain-containing protein n=1 Tax=Arachis hypogaea TaxID=3818 RepID=A0A444Y4R6_ARAHY|nr:hypothetical protein Ahy_B08g092845 [Arachis hypogaea]
MNTSKRTLAPIPLSEPYLAALRRTLSFAPSRLSQPSHPNRKPPSQIRNLAPSLATLHRRCSVVTASSAHPASACPSSIGAVCLREKGKTEKGEGGARGGRGEERKGRRGWVLTVVTVVVKAPKEREICFAEALREIDATRGRGARLCCRHRRWEEPNRERRSSLMLLQKGRKQLFNLLNQNWFEKSEKLKNANLAVSTSSLVSPLLPSQPTHRCHRQSRRRQTIRRRRTIRPRPSLHSTLRRAVGVFQRHCPALHGARLPFRSQRHRPVLPLQLPPLGSIKAPVPCAVAVVSVQPSSPIAGAIFAQFLSPCCRRFRRTLHLEWSFKNTYNKFIIQHIGLPKMSEREEHSNPAVSLAHPSLPPQPSGSSGRKNRSEIWEHFIPIEGIEKYARCKSCNDQIKYAGGTSAMRQHWKRCFESNNEQSKRQRIEGGTSVSYYIIF